MDTDDSGLDRRPDDGGSIIPADVFSSETVLPGDYRWRPRENSARSASAPMPAIRPRRAPASPPLEEVIVGTSPQAGALRDTVRAYAEDVSPVLVVGETGVGKELVARQIHALSDRSDNPFAVLNCGAIPEPLAAAELFGHVKGAFTGAVAERDGVFAEAHRGVLFLDEIGDMPLSVQAQLLRVLEDGVVRKIGARVSTRVDVRLVAATNVDLRRAVAEGRFRQDLNYRINVLVIEVPPLRARGDDVIEIAERLIRTHPNEKLRKAVITPKAADRLRAYPFPGNVRELANVLSRGLVHAKGGKILPEHLSLSPLDLGVASGAGMDVASAKEIAGRYAMLRALREADGNVKRAAEKAGRSRGTMHALIKELDGRDIAAEYDAARAHLRALLDG